ncbi:histone deacetylase family protein [Gracilimonas mengyeensis]|uniref:Acetoin utilization deacetylase AcuC n=1 Tax=Gracilimonas mengyeensis TaxID=1302730 RepID=A0A521ALG8_9BACT|nr:histone deacetylase [Gracilimonas mengyeensis]SMO35684.1 Acetoin utilization deacetylase AcuC [Gracilimonas mengyeensis]
MRVSYNPGYVADIPDDHVFPMKKFSGLHAYLIANRVIKEEEVVAPSMVDFSNLITAHTSRYARAIWDGTLTHKEERRMGLPWSKSLAIRSRLAVQGTINAGLMALQDGLAGNLAGGTHHSMPDHGEGFCVYNDVAVAIRVLQHSKWASKILVVDCDVHQGNGTAHIFANDPDVYTFSIHGEKNYPFKKPPSDLDVGLPDKTGDPDYHKALIDALDKVLSEFEPDLVFYLGGIDPLAADHFGRLSLTLAGLRERERIVIETITQKNYPLVLLLSGGYAPTLQDTVKAHAQMYEVAKEMGF